LWLLEANLRILQLLLLVLLATSSSSSPSSSPSASAPLVIPLFALLRLLLLLKLGGLVTGWLNRAELICSLLVGVSACTGAPMCFPG
jgi:hypothetical protein